MATADYLHSTTNPRTANQDGVAALVSDAASAVSWGAIFAGALVAAAASMALLALGAGLGLSSISPWAQRGVDASTFGVSSIVWVTVTQLCASALGGYLAGRLRTRWTSVHTDEVYFRDTAHGLLVWALASLVTAAMLVSTASSVAGAAVRATATVAAGATVAGTVATTVLDSSSQAVGQGAGAGSAPLAYLVDSLFRKTPSVDAATDASRLPVPEVTRIFINAGTAPTLPQQDVTYLGQLVAQSTGLSQTDAERRVSDTYAALQTSLNNAKTAATEAADKARKVGIQVTLWLFIALLSGAFIASYTAMLGGRGRDV